MKIIKTLFVAVSVLCFSGTLAFAQQATEQYVPIGASPGVSGKYSAIGRIHSMDPEYRKITVTSDSGQRTFTIGDETKIWVDRNRWKRTNLEGSYQDCEVGRRVEIMQRHDDEKVAAWIKVEARERR